MSDQEPDDVDPEDVLAAFNAEGVVKHPGRPEADQSNPADPDDDASDADAPAPG
jgi:hypothetical protein